MGSRGPHPDPRSTKSDRGANTLSRRLKKDPNGLPRMPTGLPSAAQAFWKSHAAKLFETGRLTRSDAGAFERLSRTWAQLVQLDELLEAEGMVATTAAGGAKAHPACQLRTNCEKTFLSLAQQFGLTPLSRQRTPEVEKEKPTRMRRDRQAEADLQARYFD